MVPSLNDGAELDDALDVVLLSEWRIHGVGLPYELRSSITFGRALSRNVAIAVANTATFAVSNAATGTLQVRRRHVRPESGLNS